MPSLRRYLAGDEAERRWALEINRRMTPAVRLAVQIQLVVLMASLPWIPAISLVPFFGIAGVWGRWSCCRRRRGAPS